jgi:hypothetical protein
MFVFGGNNLTNTFSDFWKIDLQPIVEYYRASAATSSSPFPADVLLPDSITWVEIPFEATGTGDAPSARIGHTMTAIGSHYFVLYGGRNFLGGTMAHGMTLIFSLLLTPPSPRFPLRCLPLPPPLQPMV